MLWMPTLVLSLLVLLLPSPTLKLKISHLCVGCQLWSCLLWHFFQDLEADKQMSSLTSNLGCEEFLLYSRIFVFELKALIVILTCQLASGLDKVLVRCLNMHIARS
jgi:hypothetical protein